VEFQIEGLLRGDAAGRAQFYKTMREIGCMTANEVRIRESLNPVEGGDSLVNLR
jgi:phage portal protein BeeE